MRIELLRSTVSNGSNCQYLTCFRVDDRIAVDAGSLGFFASPDKQSSIRHIFLTHSHIDHLAGLTSFLENIYGDGGEPVTLYGHPHTLDSIRRDIFNDRLYPDLSHLDPPLYREQRIDAGQSIRIHDVTMTAFAVDHPVPTFNYRVTSDAGAVLLITDTRVSPAIGEAITATSRLLGVFLECAFPADMSHLAHISGHLTTTQFLAESRAVPPGVPVLAIHCKARYITRIAAELEAAGRPEIALCESGHVYRFGE